jgi:hypothetical protein
MHVLQETGVAIRDNEAVTHTLDPEDQRVFLEQKQAVLRWDVSSVIEFAIWLREQGNECFAQGDFEQALHCYSICVQRCPQVSCTYSRPPQMLWPFLCVEPFRVFQPCLRSFQAWQVLSIGIQRVQSCSIE